MSPLPHSNMSSHVDTQTIAIIVGNIYWSTMFVTDEQAGAIIGVTMILGIPYAIIKYNNRIEAAAK
jgi:hypothetical protein